MGQWRSQVRTDERQPEQGLVHGSVSEVVPRPPSAVVSIPWYSWNGRCGRTASVGCHTAGQGETQVQTHTLTGTRWSARPAVREGRVEWGWRMGAKRSYARARWQWTLLQSRSAAAGSSPTLCMACAPWPCEILTAYCPEMPTTSYPCTRPMDKHL